MNSPTDQRASARLARFESGLPELDDILGGGFAAGATYVVQGSPGTGKTILANQICFAQAARGRKSLYLTLMSESFSQMFAFLGSHDFFDLTRIPDYIYYASAYPTLRDEGIDALLHLIVQEIRERRPSLLVFDGFLAIGEFLDPKRRDNEFRRFLNELGALAAQNRITMLLLTNSDRSPSSPEYTMIDGWIELIDDLSPHQPRRELVVHKHRGSAILRGRHDYRIASPGLVVHPRIEAGAPAREPAAASASARLASGIAGLDAMMGGGIPAGSTTAVVGPTGSGKTTVGLHFAAGATPAEPALFVGFLDSAARLVAKAAGLGLDLAPKVEAGTTQILRIPPVGPQIDEIGWRIVAAVEASGARRVVIDGLAETCRSLADVPRLRCFLSALDDRLVALGATILHTCEVPDLLFPTSLETGQFFPVVDNTLLLHYALSGYAVERRATLLKVRDSDFDHHGRAFRITGNGLVLDAAAGDEEARAADVSTAARRPGSGVGS